jgi:hypothetical protein
MPRLFWPATVVALCMLALPSAAFSAYAPKLEVKIEPATADGPTAITSTITQATGEDASKTVKVFFPRGFQANASAKVSGCSAADADAKACKPDSQVGNALAEATGVGTLEGPVHLITDPGKIHLAMFLKGGPAGLVEQRIDGVVTIQPDGSFLSTFDNLPDVQTTLFKLSFLGGDKSLVLTPRTCGTFPFKGEFTSQKGEAAKSESAVDITGCSGGGTKPEIEAASTSPRRFRPVRTVAQRTRRGYGTRLRWTLSQETAGTRIKVERKVGRSYRKVSSFVGTGKEGANSLKYEGRTGSGKPLRAGAYRFSLQTTSRTGVKSSVRRVGFTVLR